MISHFGPGFLSTTPQYSYEIIDFWFYNSSNALVMYDFLVSFQMQSD